MTQPEMNRSANAAAPDLLTALKRLVDRAESDPTALGWCREELDAARAAIAKAEAPSAADTLDRLRTLQAEAAKWPWDGGPQREEAHDDA